MIAASLVLAGCLVLVALVLPPRLARAGWPQRAPGLGVVLWQALGLAGGMLALLLLLTVAVTPLGSTHREALQHLDQAGPLTWVVGGLALALLGRLVGVLLLSTARTLRTRSANRVLVDLVAQPNLLLRGASVVDHHVPLAYCLPGRRSRLVVSLGTLDLLNQDELRAVLAHEHAHLSQRHDLVVLPFAALGATFPGTRSVRIARSAVALLIELLADDVAARRHDRDHLARALWKIGSGPTPAGALGVTGSDVLLRAQRLLAPPRPLPAYQRAGVVLLAATIVLSPFLGIVVPWV